jgi:hypothetical protein
MDKTIQTSLCKGLRACGISKPLTHEVLNTLAKWLDNNGPEWTVKRIKDLRQWYETFLSGEPVAPGWFRHTKDNMPLGVWAKVFELPTAKALGVLSSGTAFYSRTFSETQQKKFLHGIAGNGTQNLDRLKELVKAAGLPEYLWPNPPKAMPEIAFPTIFDMNGSCPVHDGRSTVRPDGNIGKALKALDESWESVPQVTFDFLDRMDLLGYMPPGVLGNEYTLELNKPHSPIVGRVSVLQEPELKARVVANPNRVMQVTLEPLKQVLMDLVRANPTDCIFNQEEGMMWVQANLKIGRTLAGSDLTSASDLLDLDGCLFLLEQVYGLNRIKGYQDYISYYREVSRADWWCPSLKRTVRWEQGDPLGTGPSIGILSEANAAACTIALALCFRSGIIRNTEHRPSAYFRVLGDDVIMDARMQPLYEQVIQALGGEINHSKTLTSNKVAEFAGRIVTPEKVFMKKIKYCEPSDSSFMSYMSQLGDQAKYFLRPNQRRAYEFFKYVPGIAVNGPWVMDSYGVPFQSRYQWYLEEVEPALRREEPDRPLADYEAVLLRAKLSLAEAGEPVYDCQKDMASPYIDSGYLPEQVTESFKAGGDPRLQDGATQLHWLTGKLRFGRIQPFTSWQATHPAADAPSGLGGSAAEIDPSEEVSNDDFDIEE